MLVTAMKRLIIALLLISSAALAKGPDVGYPSAEDINAQISSVTTSLAGKASITGENITATSTFANAIGCPQIKVKILTGTTASTDGGYVDAAHGLTFSKIRGATLLVQSAADTLVNCNYTVPDQSNVQFILYDVNYRIINKTGNSSEVTSKPYILTIFYVE